MSFYPVTPPRTWAARTHQVRHHNTTASHQAAKSQLTTTP